MNSEKKTKRLLFTITDTIKQKCDEILDNNGQNDSDGILLDLLIIKDLTSLAEEIEKLRK